jgi:predicted O-methyltransferase YrrM
MIREITIAAKNVLLGGNIKTLAFLTKPREGVFYTGECLFLERLMHPNGDLPQRCVWDALGTTSDIPVVLHPVALKHWFNQVSSYQADIIALSMLCRLIKPKKIFEIGTLYGSSALQMALNAPEAEVFTLDLEGPAHLSTTEIDRRLVAEGQKKRLVFAGMPEEQRIKALTGDSAIFDFGPFENSIDLFYIDGAHSYEYVKNDTMKALRCVREGGIIAWHDYGRCGVNGVSKWLNQFRAEGNNLSRIPGGSLAYLATEKQR